MVHVSVVMPVLDSHEVVRRQFLHLSRILPDDWEAVIVDDGSTPPLELPGSHPRIRLLATNDFRPWTQTAARNLGARNAKGEYLFFVDVDHMLTPAAIDEVSAFSGERMYFRRCWGALDESGRLLTDKVQLIESGFPWPANDSHPGVPPGILLVRSDIFFAAGGWNESFCGSYGPEDIELGRRLDAFCEPETSTQPIAVVLGARTHGLSRSMEVGRV